VLFGEDASAQALDGVIIEDGNGGLQDDWPRVDLLGHKVDGAAGDFDTVSEGVGLRVQPPGERRQQGGVDIQNALLESSYDLGVEDAVEPSKDDNLHPVAEQGFADREVLRFARWVGVTLDDDGRDARRGGAVERRDARVIADDDDDLAAESSRGVCIEKGLQVGATAGDENANSAHERAKRSGAMPRSRLGSRASLSISSWTGIGYSPVKQAVQNRSAGKPTAR
jgi:hypothetical protein